LTDNRPNFYGIAKVIQLDHEELLRRMYYLIDVLFPIRRSTASIKKQIGLKG